VVVRKTVAVLAHVEVLRLGSAGEGRGGPSMIPMWRTWRMKHRRCRQRDASKAWDV
jgi:nitroimidazol reductase NimA-like FMN-containing flavoprotein (pyridoxamine 5'-phosphate oxidase superfamily)